LLLYLIEKDEFDIYDIPVALIADQYMEYMQTTGQIDLDHIGDFLIMASYLLNLKSRMLLPEMNREEEPDGELADPREELVQRLMEYKKYKLAAEYLGLRFNDDEGRVYFRNGQDEPEWMEREITASLNALVRAWYDLWEKNNADQEYSLPQSDVNVGEKMDSILRALPRNGQKVVFQELYAGVSVRREVLAFFLALLELIRLQRVEAEQEKRFGKIVLCIRVAVNHVDAG